MKKLLKEVQYEDVVVTQIISKYNRRKADILKRLKTYINNKPEYRILSDRIDNILRTISISESVYKKFYTNEGFFDDLKTKFSDLHSQWKDRKVGMYADALTKDWQDATKEILNHFGVKDSPEKAAQLLIQNGYHPTIELTNNGLQALQGFYNDYTQIIDFVNKMNQPKSVTTSKPTLGPDELDSGTIAIGKNLLKHLDQLISDDESKLNTLIVSLPTELKQSLRDFRLNKLNKRVVLPNTIMAMDPKQKQKYTKDINDLLNDVTIPILKVIRLTAEALKLDTFNKSSGEVLKLLKAKIDKIKNKAEYNQLLIKLRILFTNLSKLSTLANKRLPAKSSMSQADYSI